MQANACKYKQMQVNASKYNEYNQIQANASKCKQMQANSNNCKQMLANANKCEQMQAIRMETLEHISKLKENSMASQVHTALIKFQFSNFINPKWFFEDTIDSIVQRQCIKQIQENASTYDASKFKQMQSNLSKCNQM